MSLFEPIPPVNEAMPIPSGARCQEASFLSGKKYIPCNAPAVAIVHHDKDGRGYYMCAPCTDHNVHNRGGKLIKMLRRRMPLEYRQAEMKQRMRRQS